METESEVARLRQQQAALERDLDHQHGVDDRLKKENNELERRLDAETRRNNDLAQQIADIDLQIHSKEDYIYGLRQDAENLRLQGAHLNESNAQSFAEIEAMNNHIRVLQRQNEDLSKELDCFVEANEAIRMRLDRRNRVEGIRTKNDVQLQSSLMNLQNAKSPMRQSVQI